MKTVREFKERVTKKLQERTSWGRGQIADVINGIYVEMLEERVQEPTDDEERDEPKKNSVETSS